MRSTAMAVVLAALAAPAIVVFSPVYFPETLFAVVCLGALVGVADRSASPRVLLIACAVAAAAVFVLGVALFFRPLTSVGIALGALTVTLWLFLPLTVGALIGRAIRRRWRHALEITAAGALAAAALGVLLMFMVAPSEAANATDCTREPACARTACQLMAERRRLFALERVTRYDGGTITCVYTAWGGVRVGTVYATARSGMSWDDGWWPRAMRFWAQ